MKRVIALILIGCLCLSCTGCKVVDYGKATEFYNAGQYTQALELYTSLGDYADSAAMAHICWQKTTYETAQAHFAAEEYRQAIPLFQELEMYMDCPVKVVESQYALAVQLLEKGEYAESIQLFESLGGYSDSASFVRKGISLWLLESLNQLDGITLTLNEEEKQTLAFISAEDKTVHLIYNRESMLLGIPNTCQFTLILNPESKEATYKASYYSASTSTILEVATGIAEPAVFAAGQGLSTKTFTQTITDPDGTVTTSQETTDAIILQSLLPEAEEIIAKNLPALLEQTGTDITPEDLGFMSLN